MRTKSEISPRFIKDLRRLTGTAAVNRSGEYRLGENARAPFRAYAG